MMQNINDKKLRSSSVFEKDFSLFLEIIYNTSKSLKSCDLLFDKHRLFIYDLINKYHKSLTSNIELHSKEIFNLSIVKTQQKILSKEYFYNGQATFRTYIFEVYKYTAKEIEKEFQKKKIDLLGINESVSFDIVLVSYIDIFMSIMQKVKNNVHKKVLIDIFINEVATTTIAGKFNITPSTVRQIKKRNLPFLQREILNYIN